MSIFVAGGTGTIGLPLVRALVASGHRVTALTRSPEKVREVEALGAAAAVADALDRGALLAAVRAARPTHVIHQLTALPKDGPRRPADLAATNRLRIDGTRHLLDAAIAAGARRFLAQSFALFAPRDGSPIDGTTDVGASIASMESQVLDATRRGDIDGVVLRYGMFYGPTVPSTRALVEMVRRRRVPVVRGDAGQLPIVHLDDAVTATVRALDAAPAGAVYDVVDDRPVSLREIVETMAELSGSRRPIQVPAWLPRLLAPYYARMTTIGVRPSNGPARLDLGWRPRYPTLRAGLADMLRRAGAAR